MLLGGILSLTNVYVGAKTGWTLGVGITSVILAFAMFKLLTRLGLGKEFSLLENNCMQSIATAAGYMTAPMISSLHFHSVFADGVWLRAKADARPVFHPAPPPTRDAIERVAARTADPGPRPWCTRPCVHAMRNLLIEYLLVPPRARGGPNPARQDRKGTGTIAPQTRGRLRVLHADVGSALPLSADLASLPADNWQQYCEWAIALEGGAGREHACPDGTVTVPTAEECAMEASAFVYCPLEVRDAEACVRAVAEEPCSGFESPACRALVDCQYPLAPTQALRSLTQDEWRTYCQWSADLQGGPGTEFECGDGTVTIQTVDQCVGRSSFFASCALTVAEATGCVREMAADPCEGIQSAACQALMACATR